MSAAKWHGKPLSYYRAEYVDKVRARGAEPLPFDEWLHDPAHSPGFRSAFLGDSRNDVVNLV